MSHSSFTSEEDFAEAYDRYADAIFRHCYFRLFSREKAKDILLKTFQDLWQFIAEGNVVDSMQHFLYRACHGLIEQSQARETTYDHRTEDHDPAALQQIELLRQVPPHDRGILVLHYIDKFSPEDMRHILGGQPEDHAQVLRNGETLLTSLLTNA